MLIDDNGRAGNDDWLQGLTVVAHSEGLTPLLTDP